MENEKRQNLLRRLGLGIVLAGMVAAAYQLTDFYKSDFEKAVEELASIGDVQDKRLLYFEQTLKPQIAAGNNDARLILARTYIQYYNIKKAEALLDKQFRQSDQLADFEYYVVAWMAAGLADDKSQKNELLQSILRQLEPFIERQHADAFWLAGQIFQDTDFVYHNTAHAIALYQQAADLGSSWGHDELAYRYSTGKDLPRNAEKAEMHGAASCAQGNKYGCIDLASHYANMLPTRPVLKVLEAYKECAKLEAPECIGMAGLYIYNGAYGVIEADEAEGLRWLNLAADRYDPAALYFMGMLYENGRHVEKDMARAKQYYQDAAWYNQADAIAALERLSQQPQ